MSCANSSPIWAVLASATRSEARSWLTHATLVLRSRAAEISRFMEAGRSIELVYGSCSVQSRPAISCCQKFSGSSCSFRRRYFFLQVFLRWCSWSQQETRIVNARDELHSQCKEEEPMAARTCSFARWILSSIRV